MGFAAMQSVIWFKERNRQMSGNIKKNALPIVGCFLVTAVLMGHIGIIDALQIGVGMLLIVIGLINAMK